MPPSSKRASAQRNSAQATSSSSATPTTTMASSPPYSVSSTSATPHASAATSTTKLSTSTKLPPVPPTPTSPAPSSKLPRFLQSPLQRDRSKSLSVDRPPSAASSSNSHSTSASHSTTSSAGSGRRSGRFLGLGGGGHSKESSTSSRERERERQRIREAERAAPSAAELLTLHEGTAVSPTSYEFDFADDGEGDGGGGAHGPSAYGATARPQRRFSVSQSTPPSSLGHGDAGGQTLQLQRSPSRLGADGPLAARLSGWFAHLAGSTSDLSLAGTVGGVLRDSVSTASALASSSSSTSRGKNSKSNGSGDAGAGGSKTSLLDKAVRYLLDGDAAPDRSAKEIWLMGVRLPGWGAEDEARVAAAASSHAHSHSHAHTLNHSSAKRPPASPSSHSSRHPPPHELAVGVVADEAAPDPGPWPAAFHAAFYAQVWCTYRAGFEPIRDLPGLSALPPPLAVSSSAAGAGAGAGGASPSHSPSQSDSSSYSHSHSHSHSSSSHSHSHSHSAHSSSSPSHSSVHSPSSPTHASSSSNTTTSSSTSTSTSKKRWWPLGGTKGWTSDAGWGCMLRTAQSLLATGLGRVGDPTNPPTPPAFPPPTRAARAAHARLLSWFLDAPAAPFGVHRMALAGKAQGKDVGMWFGPSAAAGAVRTLVEAFPACGLGVSVATDGTLFQTEVFAASHSPSSLAALHQVPAHSPSSSHGHGARSSSHGHGGHGKDGKRPETRAWGDRPVLLLLGIRLGLDGVNPIYYETIKLLYTFPQSIGIAGGRPSSSYYFVGVQGDGLFYLDPHHSRPAVPLRPFMPPPSTTRNGTSALAHDTRRSLSPEAHARGGSMSPEAGYVRAGSMSPESFVRGGSMSPDFAYVQGRGHTPMTEDELLYAPAPADNDNDNDKDDTSPAPAGGHLTPAEEAHYARAYSAAELRTFHCERVRKMPLSGLDPSMLIGFVCRDEAEWVDLRRRVGELPRTIFGIQDEPPTWPGADDDDEMGLESVSDPEEVEDVVDDGDVSSASHAVSTSSHGISNSSHVAASAFSHTHAHSSSSHSTSTTSSSARSEEVDTEEDAVAPITPLPGARFEIGAPPTTSKATDSSAFPELEGDDGFVDAASEVDIEDDWVDPVAAPPPPPPPPSSKKSSGSKGKSKGRGKKAVPVPSVHYPFPVSVEDAASPPATPAPQERQRNVTVSPRSGGVAASGQRMHTARARDGGRTQSGGVRGILTEDN